MAIHLDLYSGAYGLTLRIDVQVRDDLEALVAWIRELARGEALELDFLAKASTETTRLTSFHLVCREDEGAKHLRVEPQAPGVGILWAGPRDYWDDIDQLIQPFLAQDAPGHQYLTHEGVDDALVELAYLER
jgi:hypothetical protein